MSRTFQHRVTPSALVSILLLAFLTLYFFWHRGGFHVIIALILLVTTTLVIERVIHTTYTMTDDGFLEIYQGRFSDVRRVPLTDIISVEVKKPLLGISNYVLIMYGANHFVSVQPDNEEAFIHEIKKRQDEISRRVDK